MTRRAVALIWLALVGCKNKPAYRDAAPRPAAGMLRGTYALTYYWLSAEGDDADTAPQQAADTTVFDKTCAPLASVSVAFANELALHGAGKLSDGRVLGVAGECSCKRSPCFRVVEQPWGVGADNRPLVPFRSLAVDRELIPIGAALWIEELDGVALPGAAASAHDGCVIADDVGGRITGERVDWFVGRRPHYRELDRTLKLTQVRVFDGGERCPPR